MSEPKGPIRLTKADLFSAKVDAVIEEQEFLNRGVPEIAPQSFSRRIFFSSWFYLSIFAGFGAFLGWLAVEPFFDDPTIDQPQQSGAAIFFFATVAGCAGCFLGLGEGIMCRNPLRALVSGGVGLAAGLVLGLILIFPAGLTALAIRALGQGALGINPERGQGSFFALLMVLMISRSTAWAIAGISAGVGQGLAVLDGKVVLNGIVGGILGGLLGGLLFDPISLVWGDLEQATVSRGIGFTTIGIMVGLFVGLVEQWTKTAWVLMKAGPLAGKQFVIHRNPTTLGSSPKSDIYLFKDADIEPVHALIHNLGGRYEIEDQGTQAQTFVNGSPIARRPLVSGDVIELGKTVLVFDLRNVGG